MSETLRVAVIGAGRIGRQHAKWYRSAGCDVVGFLGSSPESTARTQVLLNEALGCAVPGYTDFQRLVAETEPAAVSICSPNALHCEHVLQAIDAGLHVFCEKPLAWDSRQDPVQNLGDAQRMLAAAQRRGVLLGMNAQYVAAEPLYREWYERERERGPLGAVERFEVVMQSRGRTDSVTAYDTWVDLASHPLSLLLKWVPEACLYAESVQCAQSGKEITVNFSCVSRDNTLCECVIHLGHVAEGPVRRSLGVNGFMLDYEGRNDARGIFRSYLRQGDSEREYPDFLQTSIQHFVQAVRGEGVLPLNAAEAYRNLELQVRLLEIGNITRGAS
ncbi:MAG TPA: Gfo/Idh/MocA family oxidoreductase [Armatimonadota bacterium]|nr:Gfo/Idh/MocA family oxidoreductase [Armatimonadota bacterium]